MVRSALHALLPLITVRHSWLLQCGEQRDSIIIVNELSVDELHQQIFSRYMNTMERRETSYKFIIRAVGLSCLRQRIERSQTLLRVRKRCIAR